MNTSKENRRLLQILLAAYVLLTFGVTLLVREPVGRELIQTEWLLCYKGQDAKMLADGIFNILLFVPIGVLVALVSGKGRLLLSTLAGLFISQTIKCSQLIWQRGTFDVNDLLNNTVGAFLGGAAVVLVFRLRRNV
jgi:hypothetical protein